MFGYSHYIRVDSGGNVIHTFSSAFEQQMEGDILVAEDAGRHYNPDLWYNAVIPRLQYVNGELKERTEDELSVLWSQYLDEHPFPKSQEEEIAELKQLVADLASLQLGV
ncbi:hypothetical protein KIH86_23910 [Paenibacillus sp. HN-1]|uniref:hypothetical protein n=1 Tax=Paenibacillus TaxID=44249 RepID=UPI001CA8891C|nr:MULTISPECIES: hypothetical protein [Paenibacillus]MBY9081197.1 hypothetical protein [Paenibacillus sp. CGMCC 1.18879]MBY9087234.1 hypothetical protein [Paenibacillus sinensis]